MSDNLFIVSYEGMNGTQTNIRSILVNDINYWSLEDVIFALSLENKEITGKNNLSMKTIVMAQLKTLDDDEFVNTVLEKGRSEVFVSRSGMYRVLSQDTTPAGKRFQRWLFHEVIPALNDYGVYPAPTNSSSKLKTMAMALKAQTDLIIQAIDKIEDLESTQNEHEVRISNIESLANAIPPGLITPKQRLDDLGVWNINLDQVHAVCERYYFANECSRFKNNGASRYETYYNIEVVDNAISEVRNYSQYL